MNNRVSDVILGIVFFGALIGLGVATIVLSDFKFGVTRYDVEILSPDVGYLQAGDPVLLFGMPSGKVVNIRRLGQPREVALPGGRPVLCSVAIDARLDVDVYTALPVDSALIIEDRGFLGGKLIRVAAGSSTQMFERGKPLVAFYSVSALQSAGEIIAENREPVRRAFEALVQMLEQGNRGGGLLGALLWDEPMKAAFKSAIDNVADISDGLRRGQGTIGRLLVEDDIYTDAQLTLGNVDGFFASAKEVADRIRSGEGTVGRLIYTDEMHDRLLALSDDLSGDKGLLGALIHDEELATKFRHIVDQVLGAVEDVGSFLFGTF
jgi:phospholipid/cholesterol/gamma-HCH transport system substrate-binding protein